MNGKKIKFLLINPTSECWRTDRTKKKKSGTRSFRFSMYTSLCVASSVPDYVEPQIIDEDIEEIDFDTYADVIGISFMTFNAPRAYEIADKFRNEKKKTVFFGGFHPSFVPDEAIQHCDAICIGEAECNLSQMFDDYRNGTLKRFYKDCNQADLSQKVIINRNLISGSDYAPVDVVQATRGCPNLCKFCSIASFYKNQFRTKPVDDFLEEIKELRTHLLFIDDNIIADREYAIELFTKMIPLKKIWFSQCSISLAKDPKLLELASKSGCRGLFIGLESIEQENLKKWDKNFNTSEFYLDEIDRLHYYKIAVTAGIVLGDDCDDRHTFRKTLQFLDDAKIDALQATILTPFPGTELFREFDKQGRIVDYNWENYDFSHAVFEPTNMTRATLQAGHDWLLTNFYSKKSIFRRIFRQLSYLEMGMVLKASVPINFHYRNRLTYNHTIADQKLAYDF